MKMSDRPKNLRPREKLQSRGAAVLSDYELLSDDSDSDLTYEGPLNV